MAQKKPLDKLKAWSYSTYTQYTKCPRSVCFDKVMRIRIEEPPNPHFEKGDRVHAAAQSFVSSKGRAPKVSKELVKFEGRLKELRSLKSNCELEWTFTEQFGYTGWFDKDAWLRMKVDVCSTSPLLIQIVDWKTGKVHPEHRQQRSLYALGGLQLVLLNRIEADAGKVRLLASHCYTDTGQTATEEYLMRDLAGLKREWRTRIKQMMNDTVYPTNPGSHCRWCRFAKSKGGPCPENL